MIMFMQTLRTTVLTMARLILILNVCMIITIANTSANESVIQNDSDMESDSPSPVNKIIHISQYNIEFTLKLEENIPTFYGQSNITFIILKKTKAIYLYAQKLDIIKENIIISQKGSTEYPYVTVVLTEDKTDLEGKQVIILRFGSMIELGEYYLHIKYRISTNETEGLIRTNYTDTLGKQRWLFSMNLKPNASRRLFPSFNQTLSTKYNITIYHPRDYIALSNMPILWKLISSSKTWTSFHITPEIYPDQVAIVLIDSSFKNFEEKGGIVMWCRPEMALEMRYAHYMASKIALLFNAIYHRIHRPISKTAYVAIPSPSLETVEGWGIIIFREELLRYNPAIHFYDRKAAISTIVATQMVQEYGNLVNPSWNHLQLIKGLSNVLGLNILKQLYKHEPVESIESHMISLILYRIQHQARHDNELINVPIYEKLKKPNCANNNFYRTDCIFDLPCCLKETVSIQILESLMSEDLFNNITVEYFYTHLFSYTALEDLWTSFQQRSVDLPFEYIHEMLAYPNTTSTYDVTRIIRTWITQKYYPVVTVNQSERKGTLIIKQKSVNTKDVNKNARWWIPITISQPTNTEFNCSKLTAWLTPKKQFEIYYPINGSNFYMFNIQYNGNYLL